jgi:glycosyltransferase involved in cell wall biosynthesis
VSLPRVLLVISATLPRGPVLVGPRKDYRVLAEKMDADILDIRAASQSRVCRLLTSAAGVAVGQAWQAFRRRGDYDVIVTDGEHIGLPLALLLKLTGSPIKHVTIGHRLTAWKKRPLFRWLRAQTRMNRIAVHSNQQYQAAINQLRIPAEQLVLLPYQVDTDFWRPQVAAEERQICSAGIEFRDYPTLVRAADGLDVRVVIGAASHWSKRRNTATEEARPENVEVASFDYFALRELYARSMIVVVPLSDTDFQAGVTTILEAMAMGKPVIVTHTAGQTDVVEDRRTTTRGPVPRRRPESMLKMVAASAGVEIAPNGFYVPPGDSDALRRAIIHLVAHPAERQRLGEAGRQAAQRLLTVDQFAERVAQIVYQTLTPQITPEFALGTRAVADA